MTEVWTSPRSRQERDRQQRHLAFEAICQAMEMDGLTEQTGFELLRTQPAVSLYAEPYIDEQRGQEMLAKAGDA